MIRHCAIGMAFLACLTLVTAPVGAQTECDSLAMTITATFPNDPGFEGLWKYTLHGTWDLGGGALALSHINILPELGGCDCICETDLIVFDTPAGTSTGTDGVGAPCLEEYAGEFLCTGDPSVASPLDTKATIKFDALNVNCEPDGSGGGTWCFYTRLSPAGSATFPEGIAIKHGTTTCTGPVTGQMPLCDCNVSVDESTWGQVKQQYFDDSSK
jgi:hypothetical protein